MESSLDTVQQSQSSFLGGESSESLGGMSMNPPAFQLMVNDGGTTTNSNANSMEEEAEEELTPAVVTKSGGADIFWNSNKIDTIPTLTQISIGPEGANSEGWFPVTYNGQMGWINENDFTTQVNDFSIPVVVTKSGGADIFWDSNKIDTVPERTQISIGPEATNSEGWYPVTYNSQRGWINEDDFSTDVKDYDIKAIITKRGGADYVYNANVLGNIPEGAEISIEQGSGPWYAVAYNNLAGWINQNDFTLSSEYMVPAKVTSAGGTELKEGDSSLGNIPYGTVISAEIRDDGNGYTNVSYETGGETKKGKIPNNSFTYGDGGNDSMVPAIVLAEGGTQMYLGDRAGSIPIPEGANISAEVKETDQNKTFAEYNSRKGYIPNSSFLYAHSRGNEMQPAIVTKTGGATMISGSRSISAPQGASLLAEEELDSNGYARASFRGGIWYLKPVDFAFTNIEEEDYFAPVSTPITDSTESDQSGSSNSEESSNENENENASSGANENTNANSGENSNENANSGSNANANANAAPAQGADVAVPTRNGVVSKTGGTSLEKGGVSIREIPLGGILDLFNILSTSVGDYYEVNHNRTFGYIKVEDVTPVTPRFVHETTLVSLLLGTAASPIEEGASGSGISIVQQALLELDFLAVANVTGTFDSNTASAIKMFQEAKGLTETEKLDSPTMASLNSQFVDHGAENSLLSSTRTKFLSKTRRISESEEDSFKAVIDKSTAGGGSVSEAPAFVDEVDGKNFRDSVEDLFKNEIDRLYNLVARTGDDANRDDDNLLSWGSVEGVANKAKAAVDRSFGNLATKPAFSGTGSNPFLIDVYDHYTNLETEDDAWKLTYFRWRTGSILGGHAGQTLFRKHSAIASRDAESAIIENAKNAVWYDGDYKDKVFEITRNWYGYNDESGIYLQRFKPQGQDGTEDKEKGRETMWDLYHLIIHEYFHALEHPDHKSYRAQRFPGNRGNKVLWEGIPDYFAQIIVNNTSYDPAFRASIEGPYHEEGVEHTLSYDSAYSESKEAEQVAGIIGLPNLCAAFFLGQTEFYEHSEDVQETLSADDSSAGASESESGSSESAS